VRGVSGRSMGGVVPLQPSGFGQQGVSRGGVTWAGVLVGVLLCVLGVALVLVVFQVFQPA
jgi:hypothetical protein